MTRTSTAQKVLCTALSSKAFRFAKKVIPPSVGLAAFLSVGPAACLDSMMTHGECIEVSKGCRFYSINACPTDRGCKLFRLCVCDSLDHDECLKRACSTQTTEEACSSTLGCHSKEICESTPVECWKYQDSDSCSEHADCRWTED